jgi:hypothetical protein
VAKNILHMLSSLKHMSPFDVNMALDAGFDSVTSYGSVTLDEITPLIQDAMFSRSPRDAARTCVFFGGNDAGLALDMMQALKATLLKPFEISSFADPAGSFTTAAAMVACVEKILKKRKSRAFAKTKIKTLINPRVDHPRTRPKPVRGRVLQQYRWKAVIRIPSWSSNSLSRTISVCSRGVSQHIQQFRARDGRAACGGEHSH